MSDKMREALEAAKNSMLLELGVANTAPIIEQIDEALKEPCVDIENIKDVAFHAGYNQREHELKVAGTEWYKDGYEDGLVRGKTITEQHIINAQPYEIATDVGVKYSAKGECQPEASVKITRKLEDGDQISELIKADWTRGVDEVMTAIDEIKKRNAWVK